MLSSPSSTIALFTNNRGMRILDIIEATTVDGPGFRVAVYFAGCAHDCPGCHNPQSHDFSGGRFITVGDLAAELLATGLDVTFSGGDPAYQPEEASALAEILRSNGRSIWLYTGFTFEQLIATDSGRKLAESVNVIVDGPFVQALRDAKLQFRGSSNQRIINARQSLNENRIVLWHSDF